VQDWLACQEEIARLARGRLFFVGGAPRSGTTWLQQILDSHPEVSCRGEGLFMQALAQPLAAMMAERRRALEAKNGTVMRHTGGYPLPEPEDVEHLIGTAVLLSLRRQVAGGAFQAVGEKTPENVFFYPRLKALFPGAKLVAIARDPRDVLTSAWHFFRSDGGDEAAKVEFVRQAMPSIAEGARALIALRRAHPADTVLVTYEGLQATPAPIVAGLFAFLGVANDRPVVEHCLAQTAFARLAGGRAKGEGRDGSFFRKGVVGDWRSTLSPEINEMMLAELGWMFEPFGWQR
jgi:hypothetical protein